MQLLMYMYKVQGLRHLYQSVMNFGLWDQDVAFQLNLCEFLEYQLYGCYFKPLSIWYD